MLVLLKFVDGLPTHPLGWRIGGLKLGEGRLQFLKAPVQLIVLGVRNERVILHVIPMVVPSDDGAKLFDEGPGLFDGKGLGLQIIEGFLQVSRILKQTHGQFRRA